MTDPEHTPDNDKEKIRIYNNRGETRDFPKDKKSRIYVRARMYPGLSISRSLGDVLAHHIGVISEPQISYRSLENGSFVAVGTDGIWDLLTIEDVSEIIHDYGREIGVLTEVICNKVRDSCISEGYTLDDMTLVIGYFN